VSLRAKQAVDFWLGGLLLLLLFPLVRGLGLLLRRDHSLGDRKGCAVIKLVGAGSLFQAMPSLHAIRGEFPAGRFYLVGTRAVTEFAESFGWFDACWVIDDTNPWRLLRSCLIALYRIAQNCDHMIDLEIHSRLTTIFTVFTFVRNRIGFIDEIAFWRRGFYTHTTFFNVQGPVYAFYDMLAAWFGIARVPVEAFHGAFRNHALSCALPGDVTLPARYVVVAPGCSDFGKERQLLPGEWQTVLAQILDDDTGILLLGGGADQRLCEAIIQEIGKGQNLAGRLPIAQSARLLASADRFFGIDSLLLHIARALGVPTTSIWGPSDPATRLRPRAIEDTIQYAKMSCSPCIHVHETPPCGGARPCIPQALLGPRQSLSHMPAVATIGWATDPAAQTTQVEVSYD
jgi:ADP-heptose:LPS heptosyltransferase